MKIIQIGNKTLRRVSELIPEKEIESTKTQELLKKMYDSLRKESQGIGLAAVQIGIPKTVFIVSEYVSENHMETENAEELKKRKEKEKYMVFINPKITKISKKRAILNEGCLSVEGRFGKVKRSTNLTVEALDEKGRKFKRGAGGLLAQVIQHEMDHLNGTLFVDKTEDTK